MSPNIVPRERAFRPITGMGLFVDAGKAMSLGSVQPRGPHMQAQDIFSDVFFRRVCACLDQSPDTPPYRFLASADLM
ncbi:hypothetical protein BS47DRAFT_1335286 [Hydnum rufescens UP504]|uniref:Uncharacterized protein n=1 Tax=Hydnum rufescens UP504 TaxID=1448309 RepID=A0A9P6BBY3_9AGAM|nr:hypothetical protein BS47DRAFT_1335286 [Hydnum rufescens UP504]